MPALTPEQEMLVPCPFCNSPLDSFVQDVDEGFARGPGLVYVVCDCSAMGPGGKTRAEAIANWNRRAQLEAVQEAPSLADFASAAELVCRAERVAAEDTKAPEDAAYNQAIEHCIAAIRSLVPDTGIHAQTGVKESTIQQPVQAVPDRITEYLMSQLRSIADLEPVDAMLDPQWSSRIAKFALATVAAKSAPGEPSQ
jgi:hypothetical protein